jgi:hypothetical protein
MNVDAMARGGGLSSRLTALAGLLSTATTLVC